MNLEHDLQQALRRKEPPEGFEDRVLERVASGEPERAALPTSDWRRFAMPIAASIAIVIGGSYYVIQRDAQSLVPASTPYAEGERAAHNVVRALAIASEKVSEVQNKVEEITHHEAETAH